MSLEDIQKLAELKDLEITPAEAQQVLDELTDAHGLTGEEDLRKFVGELGQAAEDAIANA